MINDFTNIQMEHMRRLHLIAMEEQSEQNSNTQAAQAGERFMRAASLLDEDSFLGWQIHTDPDGCDKGFVFSHGTSEAESEDYDWIFDKCAKAERTEFAARNEVYEPGRRVYVLTASDEAGKKRPSRNRYYYDEDYHDDKRDSLFREMFGMLAEKRAIMQVTAGPAEGVRTVMISIPEAMPLRIRSMISLIFPETELKEIKESAEPGKGTSDEVISDIIEMMLNTLMSRTERDNDSGRNQASSGMVSLDELIGLEDVKKQIRRIGAFARMKHAMAADECKDMPVSLNMEFVGNPGTAKTTVARIVARILWEAGLVTEGEVVEAGRADLVAGYEGQTAAKVKELFRKAKGKVLFIDEAYSLLEDREGHFGDEAINTIVQEMENNREDTVVIFAGYPDRMEDFMKRNPGLRSRVPFHISFRDYSAREMLQIAELEAHQHGFSISPDALESVQQICEAAAGRPELGNGRFCRNLIENAIFSYAERVYGDSGRSAAEAAPHELTAEDFASLPGFPEEKAAHPIGFRVG